MSGLDGYCTDCESRTKIHNGRCGCGSGRVIADAETKMSHTIIETAVECPTCHGDGNDITGIYDHCMNCNGTGRLSASVGDHDKPDCPVCAKPIADNDLCATDIELGICHAACLEGVPVVNLDTGEPSDGPISTYRYGDLPQANPSRLFALPA